MAETGINVRSLQKSWRIAMPATLEKAARGASNGNLGTIKGFASLESPDHAKEEVIQRGLSWEYWLENGHFKWNHETKDHQSAPSEFVGVGTKAQATRHDGVEATYVEGVLFDTPMARDVLELAKSLQKVGRQIGLSVEGGIQVRMDSDNRVVHWDAAAKKWLDEQGQPAGEGKRIAQAVVVDVTITPHPMHPDARASVEQLTRSLTAALDVGYPQPSPAEERGAGAALVPQSGVASKKKRLAKGDDDEGTDEPAEQEQSEQEEADVGDDPDLALSHDQACLKAMQRFPNLTFGQASALVKVISDELNRGCSARPIAGGSR